MLRKFGAAAIVGVLVTTGTALPASAEEQAEEIVDVVEQAEEDTFDVVSENVDVTEAIDGDFEATVKGEKIEIPEESDDPIEIESDEGTLEIDLPGTDTQDGQLVGDSVAYPNVDHDLGIVVDATEDGLRVSAVIESFEASHVLDFGLTIPDNGYLQLEDDDSVSVRNQDGDVVHSIAPPWATDANGTPVETWYKVKGETLTQHVNPTTVTAYPITADPEFRRSWWGVTWKLNSSELRELYYIAGISLPIYGAIGLYCSSATAGICALPWSVIAVAIGLTIGAIRLCENSKGVDIHMAYNGSRWCSGY